MEQTPTESSAGGTLIYISQSLLYKPRKDLQIYCPKELESTFIELLIPNRQSHLIGVVYKHPSMKHDKFNNNFMNVLLEKLTPENKPSIITDDFNLNLIKYMQNTGVNQFLENILSNNFIPQITLPTRITEKTATPTDNIFKNSYKHNSIYLSGNITTYISDHLPQFLVIENLKQPFHLTKILQSPSGTIIISTKRHSKQNYVS